MSGIINFSEAASLGVHALVFFAADPDRVATAKIIAEHFGLSRTHMAKILQRLVRSGLLISTRGPAGGFKLGREAPEITLLEIYRAIEGRQECRGCLLTTNVCRGGRCLLGNLIDEVNGRILEALGEISLADLTRSYLEGGGLAGPGREPQP